jgi:hypothetical protein
VLREHLLLIDTLDEAISAGQEVEARMLVSVIRLQTKPLPRGLLLSARCKLTDFSPFEARSIHTLCGTALPLGVSFTPDMTVTSF